MKFRCGKCDEEFDAQMYVKCPNCGEQMRVHPVPIYKNVQSSVRE